MNHIRILGWTPRTAGTLRGFVEVQLRSGMILSDVAIHEKAGSCWASPSSKPMLDRNGCALKDPDTGKIRYAPVVSFTSKAVRTKFSEAVIAALIAAHPEALR